MSDCRFGVSPVNYPDPDPETFKTLPGEGKKGWIVELHVRSAFLLIVLFHMALFYFFPDFLKKNLLYSCAFESLNQYRHVIIYSAAGKNYVISV